MLASFKLYSGEGWPCSQTRPEEEKRGESSKETKKTCKYGQTKAEFREKIASRQENTQIQGVYAGRQQSAAICSRNQPGRSINADASNGIQEALKGRSGVDKANTKHATVKVVKQKREGKKTSLRVASWNKGGANQDLCKKRNEIALQLHGLDIDCMGINEANLKEGADMQAADIPGYILRWDIGRENQKKKIARVVVYIKEELSFDRVKDHMKNDLMPEVWLKVGHKGTRRTLLGFVYREHTPVGTQDSSLKHQEATWTAWLEARDQIRRGKEGVIILGDINLDMNKTKEAKYGKGKMLKAMLEKFAGNDWVQLVSSPTHFWNRAGQCGDSRIDHIWTNAPGKVGNSGQMETGASDHHLVWVERKATNLAEKVKATQKRAMKNFSLERLEDLCRKEDWNYQGTEADTEELLENRVKQLEEMITYVLESVAPMTIKRLKKGGKPKWMTTILEARIKERRMARQKASWSKLEVDEQKARKIRNEVAKEVKGAEKQSMKRKLEDLSKNSSDAWIAVGEFLGWRKPVNPTMLVKYGNILTGDQEMAEAMLDQYKMKEIEVEQALGRAQGNFLNMSRRMTKDNKGKFNFRKVTSSEVKEQIKSVDNKESFGHDQISYGFLKKMSTWIVPEITRIIILFQIGFFSAFLA